jgi:hypothetical protein
MSDDMPAMAGKLEGPMQKVFTTTPGAVVRIGNHGMASNDEPALVPAEVAAELAKDPLFRVEAPEDGTGFPPPPRKAEPEPKLPVDEMKRASKGLAKEKE